MREQSVLHPNALIRRVSSPQNKDSKMNLFTRKMLLLLGVMFFIGLGTAEAKKKKQRESVGERSEQVVSSEVNKLIEYGKELLGRRYRSRGPGGIILDCSGFVNYVFSRLDIKLPRSSSAMSGVTRRVAQSDIRPGDLLYFAGRSAGSGRVGHVGMVISVDGDDISMIHSSTSRGVIIEKYNRSAYFSRRYLGAGRVEALSHVIGNDGSDSSEGEN